MNAQVYCTEAELIDDLRLNGAENGLLARILAASRFLQRRFGDFLPVIGTNVYMPTNRRSLNVDPLLSVNEITVDGTVLDTACYALQPYGGHWRSGPYTRIEHLTDIWWSDTVVEGKWGLYDEAESLGVNATINNSALILSVGNGALVSPGMVIELENEQILVTGWSSPTLATAQLAEDVDEAQEEIEVDDGQEFNTGEVIRLSTEDCVIRMVRGDILVVARGWSGTTKTTHLENDAISVLRSVTVQRGVNGTTAAAHTNAALQRCVVPEDVNWLCRQIAGLMRMKAAAGFAGKSGSAELGETFYYNEFPSQIKEIKRNYRITQI